MLNTCLGRCDAANHLCTGLAPDLLVDCRGGGNLPPGTIPLKGHSATVYAIAFSPDGKYAGHRQL